MTVRRYSSISQETTLVSALNTTATTMVVNSASVLGGITLGTGERFTLVLDPDTALEEIVYAVAPSAPGSTTITIIRGVDGTGTEGTSGIAHSAGAKVRHMAIGVDFREANNHIENTTTAHGLTLANVTLSTGTGNVSTAMLASNAVTTAKITDANVTTAKIADSNVTTAKIADSNVTTAKIADLNVTTGKLADSSVTSAKIADGTIVTADLADAAVTSAKIADGTIVAGDIADGAVTSAKILDGTIVNADINSAAAIDKTKISGTAVTLSDVGTVTGTMIASDTIANADINSSAQIAYSKLALTNGIVNADINASAAIDKTKISGTAITAGDTGTVTSTMIANGTIVNADINASAAIEWTKIAPSSTVSATELGYLDGVTSAVQTQLDAKLGTSTAASTYAPLASPALTGVPTAPTAAANTNTTQIATTAYVQAEIAELIDAAPGALDTLNELAAALGDDASFSTTVTNNLATKLPLAGGTMSGAIAMGTNKITGLGTPTSSTDAATKAYADTMLPLAGGTMSGAIAMGTNKITGVGDPTNAQDVVTKYYLDNVVLAPSNLTGPITSVGNVTSIASQTGTGTKFVVDTSPTLVTPVLGVATATSINGTTIPTSKTLVATDSTAYVVPSQTGNSGKFLTTDGTTSSWGTTVLGTFASNSAGTDADSARNISLQIDGTTYGRILVPTGSGGAMAFWTGSTPAERVRITSAGLVGIGMTPTVTFDVTGTNVRLNPTNVATNGFIFNGSSSNTNWASMQSFRTAIDGTTRFETLGSGITGIGGASGSAQLFVTNITASNVGTIIKGAASQTGDLLQVQNSAGTVLATVTSAGNVGIGITNPLADLHIGSSTTVSDFRMGNSAAATVLSMYTTSNDMVIYNATAGGVLQLGTNNTERIRIDASGNVGIGANSPKLKLQVSAATGSGAMPSLGTASGSLYVTNNDSNYGLLAGVSSSTGEVWFQAQRTDGTATAYNLLLNPSGGSVVINAVADATTTTAARGGGYMGIPQSAAAGSGAYTVVAADAGEHIYTTTTRTVTIPANASVAFPVGTVLSFISGVGATTTIAITSDTMYLAGAGTTGSRTLAAHGMATAVKVASTTWYISGNGLT